MTSDTQQDPHDPQEKQPTDATGKDSQPEAFLHIPIATLLPLIKPTIEGGTQIKQLLQRPETLTVRVTDSVEEAGRHLVSFNITNETEQGIYLESFESQEPVGYKITIRHMVPSSDGWANELRPSTFKPLLLNPHTDESFQATVPLQDWSWLNVAPYGAVSLTYSKLDEEKPATKKITFRLRRTSE